MSISLERTTGETEICLTLENSQEKSQISISCGFMEHMIELFSFHAGISLKISGSGDIQVDYHHIVEDLGIVMGKAFLELFRSQPNSRYGWSLIPMDGSLVMTSIDISGRNRLVWEVSFPSEKCGDFDMELVREFWESFTRESRVTLHVHQVCSDNSHHLAEAVFKGIGRSLRQALVGSESIQSTKGVI